MEAAAFKTAAFLVSILFVNSLLLHGSNGQPKTWIKAGYWYAGSDFFAKDIDSNLFSHLIFSFVDMDSSLYTVSIPLAYRQSISTFTDHVRIKNPSVTTLLSIWAGGRNSSIFFTMASNPLHRRSFIMSTIQTARLHSFGGVNLLWADPASGANTTSMSAFFSEWKAAADADARVTNKSRLLLTMAVTYLPIIGGALYPIHSIRENLDWVNVMAYDYYLPARDNFTGPHAALYNPSSRLNTDHGLKEWVKKGRMPARKVLLGLPYHGYGWTLLGPAKGSASVGVRSSGVAITKDGSISYSLIKWFEKNNQGDSVYNSTYVQNFYSFSSNWIVYDDIEAIRTKVAYAKNKGLLGYCVFQVSNDDKWVLSKAAAQNHVKHHQNKLRWLVISVPSVLIGVVTLYCMMFYLQRALRKSNGLIDLYDEELLGESANPSDSGDPLLRVFHFVNIEAATNNFSLENKLGEGGYGSVYKGKLRRGKEIAVKRLSKSSEQGLEEFTNEVTLTAKLQHVNLVKLLGFCIERGEKMLIYEYMPNKSLDLCLYDPAQRSLLDWGKFVEIIHGIIQGLLYLQEYSRLTIIHRDLKASNILLDEQMKPKIGDFGMARVFQKGEHEANTGRIVGTYGYVPPEYVNRGIYSTKSDVYSFGVLLLQIISGKRNSCFYGPFENLSLLEHAYDMWRDGKWSEFVDGSLDDSISPCKLVKCMQVALLCVQERGEDRPSMVEVLSMLKNETSTNIPTPKKPAFSTKTQGENDVEMSSSHVSITEMVPR